MRRRIAARAFDPATRDPDRDRQPVLRPALEGDLPSARSTGRSGSRSTRPPTSVVVQGVARRQSRCRRTPGRPLLAEQRRGARIRHSQSISALASHSAPRRTVLQRTGRGPRGSLQEVGECRPAWSSCGDSCQQSGRGATTQHGRALADCYTGGWPQVAQRAFEIGAATRRRPFKGVTNGRAGRHHVPVPRPSRPASSSFPEMIEPDARNSDERCTGRRWSRAGRALVGRRERCRPTPPWRRDPADRSVQRALSAARRERSRLRDLRPRRRRASSSRWNAGARAHQGLRGRRDHRPAFLDLLSRRRTSRPASRTWSCAVADARGTRRGRRLARAQGRHAVLGERRHHRAARCAAASSSASPRSRATSPSVGGRRKRCARARSAFASSCESVKDYGIFMLDPDGTRRELERRARAASRGTRPRRSSAGTSPSSIRPTSRRAGIRLTSSRSPRARVGYEEEGWRMRKDGSRFWANVVITALLRRERRR